MHPAVEYIPHQRGHTAHLKNDFIETTHDNLFYIFNQPIKNVLRQVPCKSLIDVNKI